MKKILFILLSLLGLSACANAQDKNYTDMDVAEFSEFLTNDSVQLIDVRTPEEYADGHIADAENINVFDSDFTDKAEKSLDRSKPIGVYCRSGKRSAEAARKLSEKGFNVTNLKGGIIAWKNKKQPVSLD